MRTIHRIAIATLVLTLAAPVSAQVTAIRYNEGPGVKLSDSFVFHPGAAVETRYDSNPLATNSDAASNSGEDIPGAAYLRLIAHMHLATTSAQRLADGDGAASPKKVQFRLKGAVAYREYLSDDTAVSNLRALEIDAGFNLKLSPARFFRFEVLDDYERRINPRNSEILPGNSFPTETVNLNLNRAMAKAHIIPGGGRLSFVAGYALNLRAYENDIYADNNNLAHEVSVIGKYLLLPKTAVLLEVNQRFYNYYNGSPYNEDSMPLRVSAGFSGLITPRLSTQLKVGYGNGFYDGGDSFNSVLALAQLAYQIGPLASARIGYQRDFEDSTYSNYVAFHKVYADYDHVLINRLILRLGADYAFRNHQGFDKLNSVPDGSPDVTALDPNLFTASVGVDYQLQDWIYLGVGYDLHLQDIPDSQERPDVVNIVSYARHQVYGKVGISY